MIDVSAFVQTLGGKAVAVYGLGLSNMSAIRALRAVGATVVAGDDKGDKLQAARDLGAETPVQFLNEDFSRYACLVLAPGIPLDFPVPHPVVTKAREAGIEILCDIEILHRCHHNRTTIGITGTNGKSTTTVLTGHILNNSGIPAVVGGNIGIPALDLDLPPEGGTIVLEMSSFQLDLCPTFAPHIAVHLNLSPDHMDRHGTMENYAASKLRLFRGRGEAVIGIDDEPSRKMFETVKAAGERALYSVSVKGPVTDGVYIQDGGVFDAMAGIATEAFRLNTSTLPGVHNHQNAAAAYCIARLLERPADAIYEAMKTFPGLRHRQFPVRAINGVAYINDSKATNAAAAARALECYRRIYWIAGGRPKEGGLDGLDGYMDRVRHAFLIGEAAEEFSKWLDRRGVPYSVSQTLDRAVSEAHHRAQSERGEPGGMGTVLLSPACASFDQFSNFEERGNLFTQLVEALPEDDV